MEELSIVLLSILAMALLVGGAIWLDQAECNAKTQNIEMAHSWSFLTGCMIEVEKWKWIPLDNYYWKDQQ